MAISQKQTNKNSRGDSLLFLHYFCFQKEVGMSNCIPALPVCALCLCCPYFSRAFI